MERSVSEVVVPVEIEDAERCRSRATSSDLAREHEGQIRSGGAAEEEAPCECAFPYLPADRVLPGSKDEVDDPGQRAFGCERVVRGDERIARVDDGPHVRGGEVVALAVKHAAAVQVEDRDAPVRTRRGRVHGYEAAGIRCR